MLLSQVSNKVRALNYSKHPNGDDDSDDDGDDDVGKKGVTINLSKYPKICSLITPPSYRSLKKGGLSLNGQQILLR